MPTPFHKDVTTPEALASSINTDHHVLRWFTLLAVQPAIQAREAKDPPTLLLYASLRKIVTEQYVLYAGLWAGLLTVLYLRQYHYLWLSLLFIPPLFSFHGRLRKCVQTIGMGIVSKDFDDATLRRKTLYQISEFYGRQYRMPSIVDTIFIWDNMTRLLVIAMIILSGSMIPLIIKIYRVNFILTFLTLTGAGYLIFMTIHTFIIYKQLQRPLPKPA